MGWNPKGDKGIMSEINITPLTDVMLVLLVIFMVTTPLMMASSFKVKLPKAVTADAEAGKGVIVSVSATGQINIDGRDTPLDGLYDGLKKAMERSTDKIVIVKADGATRNWVVVKILDTAKMAGAVRLSIATEPEKSKKER